MGTESIGRQTVDRLKTLLAEFGDRLTVTEEGGLLMIRPHAPDTFPIEVAGDSNEVVVSAVGWHDHMGAAEQAVACVMWLLTPFYRVVERRRRGDVIGSRLERYEPPGKWAGASEMETLFGVFGSKRTVELVAYQQNVVPAPAAFLNQFPLGALDETGLPTGS